MAQTIKDYLIKARKILFIGFFILIACAAAGISYYQTKNQVKRPQNAKASEIGITYYVSVKDGNDQYSGTHESTPWKTLSKVKAGTYKPGDKVLFKAGEVWEMTEAGTFDLPSSGIEGNEITIGRYGAGNNPGIKNLQTNSSGIKEKSAIRIKQKSYIIVDGVDVIGGSAGFEISDSSNITLKNFFATGTTTEGSAVMLDATSAMGLVHDIVVEDFKIVGGGSMGWGISGSPYPVKSITVRRGTIEGVGQAGGEQKHGMYVHNWQSFLIEDVSINKSWNTGLKIVGDTNAGVIRRVVITNSGQNGTGGSGSGVSLGDTRVSNITGLVFDSCVVANNPSPAIWVIDAAKNVHNITINHCTFVKNANSVHLLTGAKGWKITNTIGYQDSSWVNNNWRNPFILEGGDLDIAANTWSNNDWYFKNGGSTFEPVRVASTLLTLPKWQAKAGSPDVGSISVDPQFIDEANGNYHLQKTSPACTSGENGTYIGAYSCLDVVVSTTPEVTVTVEATVTPTPTTIPTPTTVIAVPPTSTPIPTSTPVPTVTPPIATATPKPTSTPMPTVAVVSGSSVIVIYAGGTPNGSGYPNMQLLLNGRAVASWSNVNADGSKRKSKQYTYESASKVTDWNQIQITFTNDKSGPRGDRNLFVDKITLDGVTRETEAATTTSNGSWAQGSGCGPGNKKSEWLHCNGSFTY